MKIRLKIGLLDGIVPHKHDGVSSLAHWNCHGAEIDVSDASGLAGELQVDAGGGEGHGV